MQQSAFDTVDPLRVRSAFPSLHCSIGFLTLFYSWRFGDALFPGRPRLYFWICLPLVISLWLSTIYLRHHWVPDIAAGLLLGLASADAGAASAPAPGRAAVAAPAALGVSPDHPRQDGRDQQAPRSDR